MYVHANPLVAVTHAPTSSDTPKFSGQVVVFFFYPTSVQSILEIFDCDSVASGDPSNPLMVRREAKSVCRLRIGASNSNRMCYSFVVPTSVHFQTRQDET